MVSKYWSNLENSDRCHVTAYKKYKELRPVKCSSDNDSFYISSNTAFGNKSTKWFKSQPVGINKISEFLKIIISKFYCMYNFGMVSSNCM
jgi:hypothetical protein